MPMTVACRLLPAVCNASGEALPLVGSLVLGEIFPCGVIMPVGDCSPVGDAFSPDGIMYSLIRLLESSMLRPESSPL